MNNIRIKIVMAVLLCSAIIAAACLAQPPASPLVIKVAASPMNSGRITNMLYGGFIEFIDDLVPGMWAEMLNDRGFEGVKPTNWIYYTGEPNVCDVDWDKSDCWSYDTNQPFNGKQSAKIVAKSGKPGVLTQQKLAVKKDMEYIFTGNFKTGNSRVSATVSLKSLLPDGRWMVLASSKLPKLPRAWGKVGCRMKSKGTTAAAVFELKINGSGSVWADKLSLMPTDNVYGWRKDVVEVIRAAHPGVIRLGGSLTEFGYNWKDATGPRDQRPPFWNQYWGRFETNDVGVDEFVQFCRLVGAEPLICVSFNQGAEEARQYLEYCNGNALTEWGAKRAANGRKEPYNIKFWQVGNEAYGEKYDRGCEDFAAVLRKQDPSIKILSSDCTPLLLDVAGKYLDYTCNHYYYIRDTEGCESSIREFQQIMKDAKLDHDVKLSITEWNMTAADWGPDRGKMLTLSCGLYTGRFMNVLHRCSDVVGLACRSNMTNSCCSGYIQTNPSMVIETPAYYVMKLYADHYKPVPVQVAGTMKDVDLSACRSDDSKKVTVFAVNSSENPVEVQLDLSEYGNYRPVGGEVVGDTLDRKQPDIMNHFDVPERVKTMKLQLKGNIITLPAFSVTAIECGSGT